MARQRMGVARAMPYPCSVGACGASIRGLHFRLIPGFSAWSTPVGMTVVPIRSARSDVPALAPCAKLCALVFMVRNVILPGGVRASCNSPAHSAWAGRFGMHRDLPHQT